MKKSNVRQLQREFVRLMKWLAEGDQVQIVKKGKIIALLSPPPQSSSKRRKIKMPDFAARQERIFGDKDGPLPCNSIAEERESYDY